MTIGQDTEPVTGTMSLTMDDGHRAITMTRTDKAQPTMTQPTMTQPQSSRHHDTWHQGTGRHGAAQLP